MSCHFRLIRVLLLLYLWMVFGATPATAIDPADRPVSDIRVEGLRQVDAQLVFNQIRIVKGDPYQGRIVKEDIERLTNLNKFKTVEARLDPQTDGSVVLIYVVEEMSLISDVQVVGNKVVSDQTLLSAMRLRPGDPIDDYLMDRAKRQILESYNKQGYFDTTVTIDHELLKDSQILLFKIIEGPNRRIVAIKFKDNSVYTDKQLRSRIKSKPYVFLLRKGEFSRQRTLEDAAGLRSFYRSRGYLDAEVIREIQMSPDGRDAIMTFVIHEGQQYTVVNIFVQGNEQVAQAQIQEAMRLQVGDVFAANLLEKSQIAIKNLYGDFGFIETKVTVRSVFLDEQPNMVDVLVAIEEGVHYLVGNITIKGNNVTQDRVIRRQIRKLVSGRRFIGRGIRETERRLTPSALFKQGRVTVLGNLDDEYRDVLIEIKEKNTGSVGFGAGISSDSGVIGLFDITQRNFDIVDFPENLGELFTGKAFKGAGQFMRIALQPGNKNSRYSANFREPYLFESNIFFDTAIFFFEGERNDHDEQRFGGNVGVGQRFGDVWSASVEARVDNIDLTNIESDAPVDVFAVKGTNDLTALGLSIARTDVDSRSFPTDGSRLKAGVSRVGSLGGDFDFTQATVQFVRFWTTEEDFFDRRTVLKATVRVGYIFDDNEAPIFERFYAGGQRTFRGFEFRGIGPRGIRADTGKVGDDPVGGDWMFLFGLQYNVPIYQEIVRIVFFADSGTVEQDIGMDDYRVAVGTGLRLKVPFLGQAPFALDVAFPIAKEDEDEGNVFSFDLEIPF